jgi:hypothetical protein
LGKILFWTSFAPLSLARNAIIVAIHLRAGVVPEKPGGLFTRSHFARFAQ